MVLMFAPGTGTSMGCIGSRGEMLIHSPAGGPRKAGSPRGGGKRGTPEAACGELSSIPLCPRLAQNNKNHSTGEEEFFCRPDPATTRNMKSHNYDKLGASGFVEEGTYVEPGDVVIGKCMPQKQGHAIHNKDISVALKSNERGFIDRNCHSHRHFPNTTSDGYTFAKLRLRQERTPNIGDKVLQAGGTRGGRKARRRQPPAFLASLLTWATPPCEGLRRASERAYGGAFPETQCVPWTFPFRGQNMNAIGSQGRPPPSPPARGPHDSGSRAGGAGKRGDAGAPLFLKRSLAPES